LKRQGRTLYDLKHFYLKALFQLNKNGQHNSNKSIRFQKRIALSSTFTITWLQFSFLTRGNSWKSALFGKSLCNFSIEHGELDKWIK
jgi:hypothetical protein